MSNDQADYESEQYLKPWYRAARRRWVVVILLAACGLVVGLLLSYQTAGLCQARARIRLLKDRPIGAVLAETREASDDIATTRAQLEVMRSARILEPVAQQMQLASRWKTSSEQALQRLRDSFIPRRNPYSGLVEVCVNDRDPQQAADIANCIVEVFSREASRPRVEMWKGILSHLQSETKQQQQRLIETRAKVQQLRDSLGADARLPVSDASLRQLQQLLVQAQAAAIDAKIRLDFLREQSRDTSQMLASASPTDAVAQKLAARLSDVKLRLSQLESMYGPSHRQVRAAAEERRQLLVEAEARAQSLLGDASAQLSAAQARVEHLQRELEIEQRAAIPFSNTSVELLAAVQEQELRQKLYQALSERVQRLSIELEVPMLAAEVVDRATPATQTPGASPISVVAAATLMGLLAGIGLARWIERARGSITDADEAAQRLGVSVLGAVAHNTRLLSSASLDPQAEAYRMIRNSIDFAEESLRSLAVVSAAANEGCSTTTANLAWTWAELGARVLLVDANLRRPALCQVFGVRSELGLSDFVQHGRSLDELVQRTSVPNVFVLPAGSGAAAVLTQQHLMNLLAWAEGHADVVLFDAGSALRSSTAALVARQCEATVMVARQGRLPVQRLHRALNLVNSAGSNMLGLVLTGADSDSCEPAPLPPRLLAEYEQARRKTAQQRLRQNGRKRAA